MIILSYFFLIIYIIVSLYRRKFCDGHIKVVLCYYSFKRVKVIHVQFRWYRTLKSIYREWTNFDVNLLNVILDFTFTRSVPLFSSRSHIEAYLFFHFSCIFASITVFDFFKKMSIKTIAMVECMQKSYFVLNSVWK